MGFRNLTKYALIYLVVSIFILTASSSLVSAKDNPSSPLFEESLQETLLEFNSSTKKIRNKSGKVLSRELVAVDENPDILGSDIPSDFQTYFENVKKAKFIPLILVGRAVKNPMNGPVLTSGNGSEDMRSICRPTFMGSTCRGFTCSHAFPTLSGRTCSVTCGLRSTCSNGCFCRHHPSPCAKLDNPDRLALEKLAKGNEKAVNFTIF